MLIIFAFTSNEVSTRILKILKICIAILERLTLIRKLIVIKILFLKH